MTRLLSTTLFSLTVITLPEVAQAACAHYNPASEVINGTGGADCIYAAGGNDTVTANAGVDDIFGEEGNDTIYGKDGDDRLRGGPGIDLIEGGDGEDEIWGGEDVDYLYGNTYGDWLHGGEGNDFLYGGDGDDTLEGGADNDYMSGMNGSDTFIINGNDTVVNRQMAGTCPSQGVLDNEAYDGEIDHLVIPGISLRDLSFEVLDNNLHLSTRDCQDLVVILNWQRGPSFRHLELVLDHAALDLEQFLAP